MDNSPKVYEVRQSPGRGLGAFATKLIPRGTRILAEAPLLFTKINHYLKSDLEDTFNALTPEQKDQFWALHSGHGQDPERWPSQIHSGVSAHEAQRIREQHESRLAPEKSVLSVFMVNCMEMGNGAGVFAEAARFNHSCAPNANFSWNENIEQETIHATRDIEEGEEIFLCYVDPIGDTGLRRWNLQSYGFTCNCHICEEPEPELEDDDFSSIPKTSAARRYRLVEIEEESTPSLMIYLLPEEAQAAEAEKKLKDALETAALFKEEGLYMPNLAMVYFDIATQCEAKGDYEFALRAAEQGLQVNIDCLGADHPKVEAGQEIVERLRSQLNSDGSGSSPAPDQLLPDKHTPT